MDIVASDAPCRPLSTSFFLACVLYLPGHYSHLPTSTSFSPPTARPPPPISRSVLLAVLACVLSETVKAFAPRVPAARFSQTLRLSSTDDAPGSVSTAPLSPTSNAMASYVSRTGPLVAAFGSLFLAPVLARAAADAKPAAEVVEEKVVLGPPPTDFGIQKKDFYADCIKVVNHMRYAVQMEKGNTNIAAVAQSVKDEMLDFVAFYRRFDGINGKQSFSLLYTSINVLAGHYTSYGTKFPVPEKRRKRLLQEFNDVEKNIRKKR